MAPRPPWLLKTYEFYHFWTLLGEGGLGNILTSIVSNSHIGKRLVARDTPICGSHVGTHVSKNVNYYWCVFHKSTAKPFGVLYYCHASEKPNFVCTTSYWPLTQLVFTSYSPLIDLLFNPHWPLIDLLLISYCPLINIIDLLLTSYWNLETTKEFHNSPALAKAC